MRIFSAIACFAGRDKDRQSPASRDFTISALAALIALGTWCTAHAAINAIACYGCTSDQFNSKAASIASTQHRGFIYLYDLRNGDFRKYQVEAKVNGGSYQYVANEITPSHAEKASWDAAAKAIANNRGSSTFVSRLSQTAPGFPDPNVNAFDVAVTGAYQKDISDWLNTGPGGQSHFQHDPENTAAQLASIERQIKLDGNPTTTSVTVVLKDGSQVDFRKDEGMIDYTLAAARDKSNNTIPLVYSAIGPNTYIFRHGDNGTNLANYLKNSFGIAIEAKACSNGDLNCINDGGGQMTCRYSSCGTAP